MADLAGQTFGKYQLIERMGRGGMADVYKGYQPGLDRYVAVKVMHPHLSEEADFITRFQREAKSVAALRHPHIVQVFDFDAEGEYYYMVMEYIEGGQTLKELLMALSAQNQRLPIEHTLDLMAKATDALDYAHQQGMIHRDIKPSNVLVPSVDRPVLADFGIARLMGQTGLTASGAMIGTPAYMSPEQGRGERADERSDIYAMGIVLYEMLTGQPPYDADTPYGVILKHINDPLTPPHVVMGSIPTATERVVLKSLAKDPDARYASAGAMRDALREALTNLDEITEAGVDTPPVGVVVVEGAPNSAETLAAPPMDAAPTVAASVTDEAETLAVSPDSAAPIIEAPARKRSMRWVWIALGIIAIMTVIGGAIVLGLGLLGGDWEEDIAELDDELSEMGEPDWEDEESIDQETNPDVLVEQAFAQMDEWNNDQAFTLFERALEIDPENVGALYGMGMLHMRFDEYEEASAYLEEAAEIDPENPSVYLGLGLLHANTEEYYDPDAAFDEFTMAIDGCGEDIILCASAYEERAYIQMWYFYNIDAAIGDIDQAIMLEPPMEQFAHLHAARAEFRSEAGDVEGALSDFETAYELSGWGEYLEYAAMETALVEDYDRAIAYYDRLFEEKQGEPHYLVGKGYLQWRIGDAPGAQGSVDRALTLKPGLPEGHYLAGLLRLDAGDLEEALELWQHVAGIEDVWSYNFPFFTPEFGHEIHYDMARAEFALGNFEKAQGLIEMALEFDDWWPEPFILNGDILKEMGDLAGARDSYLMALERAEDEGTIEYINSLLTGLGE